jgi:hypothetical protein
MNFMKLLAINTVEEASKTRITFRFDSAPSGAESFVLDWIEEVDKTKVAHSSTVSGIAAGNDLVVSSKFPTNKFTLTHTLTGTVVPFELDTKEWPEELTFVNENNKAVFYLPAYQATRVNQIEVKKLTGETLTTLYHGTLDYRPSYGEGEELVGLTVPSLEIDLTLRKVVVVVSLDSGDAVVTYADLVPTGYQTDETTSYEGLLDFDELGIF